MSLTKLRPSGRTLLWAAAGLIAGGMVHILAVLALPRLAAESSLAPLLEVSRVNEMVVLPPVTPETQVIPFMAPDVRYAICRFDLTDGALAVRTKLLDAAWSVSIYQADGQTAYAVSGADLDRREVDMLVTPSDDANVGVIPLARDRPASTIAVSVPARRGLVVIRAPLAGSAYAAFVDRELKQASCAIREGGKGRGLKSMPVESGP